MTSDPTPDKDDDTLAAEYALHLLDPAARAAFDERLAVEGALRARLAEWSERFAGLDDETAPVTPPAALRDTLARAIAPVRAPVAARRLSFVRLLAGATAALALGIAVVSQLPEVRLPDPVPTAQPFTPGFFAELAAPDTGLVLALAYSDATGELRVQRSAGRAPEGRVLQLWLIADGAPAPVSLGVLPDSANAVLLVDEALRPDMPGATLAVSEEPPGGSPDATPSGAVLAAAALIDA